MCVFMVYMPMSMTPPGLQDWLAATKPQPHQMVWAWPEVLQPSFPPALLWLSLCTGFKASGRLLLDPALLYPLLGAGSLPRQGFQSNGSLAGLYFPSKAVKKPPALSENISLMVSSTYSSFSQREGIDLKKKFGMKMRNRPRCLQTWPLKKR